MADDPILVAMDANAFQKWYSEHEPYLVNHIEFGFCDSARDQASLMMLRDWLLAAFYAGMTHARNTEATANDQKPRAD